MNQICCYLVAGCIRFKNVNGSQLHSINTTLIMRIFVYPSIFQLKITMLTLFPVWSFSANKTFPRTQISIVWSALFDQHCLISTVRSALLDQHCLISTVWSALFDQHCLISTVWSALSDQHCLIRQRYVIIGLHGITAGCTTPRPKFWI